MSQKLGPLQTKWVEALESGKYQQGMDCLMDFEEKHCCLGVACRVLRIKKEKRLSGWLFDGATFLPPLSVVEKLKLRGDQGNLIRKRKIGRKAYSHLAAANDDGVTFAEIAAFIRANPEAVFTGEA